MGDQPTSALDGKRLNYTYDELGTVVVELDAGKLAFEWLEGPLKGESGKGFDYRARQVGDEQYFVSWHEPEERGFVTLFLDLQNSFACSSVLAAYGTEEAQTLFDSASINSIEGI